MYNKDMEELFRLCPTLKRNDVNLWSAMRRMMKAHNLNGHKIVGNLVIDSIAYMKTIVTSSKSCGITCRTGC